MNSIRRQRTFSGRLVRALISILLIYTIQSSFKLFRRQNTGHIADKERIRERGDQVLARYGRHLMAENGPIPTTTTTTTTRSKSIATNENGTHSSANNLLNLTSTVPTTLSSSPKMAVVNDQNTNSTMAPIAITDNNSTSITDKNTTTISTENSAADGEDDATCRRSKGAVEEFPEDFLTQEQRMRGGILIHILITCYMFGLLAVVCDNYFVLSLYHICSRLRMAKDVAGATFMAIGSSAPTLFIAVVSIFFTDNAGDVGLGTVVGSTIFNTLFIVAICAMAATTPLTVSTWPLMRDAFVYSLGTFTLVFTVRDRRVFWWEAIIFVFIYAFYIVIMYFNRPLSKFFYRLTDSACQTYETVRDDLEQSSADFLASPRNTEKQQREYHKLKTQRDLEKEKLFQQQQQEEDMSDDDTYTAELEQFENKQQSPLRIPEGVANKITWLLGFPVFFLFYITIPPCCKKRWAEWYLVTFSMSVLWMGLLSYVLVWMVCIIGYTFDIPDCIMGMTFLAAGSSIPDVMASVIVVRQGSADMAISNAIGSNVFDMLCLGVPWLMKTAFIEPGEPVLIQSQSIMVSAMLLIGSIVFTVIAIHLNDWKLDFKLGIVFLLVYIVFIALATLIEFLACPCQLEDFLPN